MASVALSHVEDRYPAGTVVKAYVLPATPGAALGASVANATVQADGSLTITGLEDGTTYVLHSDTVDRRMTVTTDPPSLSGGSGAQTVASTTDVGLSVKVTGDADNRFEVLGDGTIQWGVGDPDNYDVILKRSQYGSLEVAPSGPNNYSNLNVGDPNDQYVQISSAPTGGGNPSLQMFAADASQPALSLNLTSSYPEPFVIYPGGKIEWGTGVSGAARDVTLQRFAAKTLEIPEAGGGLRLTSPDGTVHKIVTINNAGALALL